MNRIVVSLVVPMLNEETSLPQFLTYLSNIEESLGSAKAQQFEIIFSDSGSSDSGLCLIEAWTPTYFAKAIVRRSFFSAPSVAKAVNQSLENVQGKTILILPVDVRLETHAFIELLEKSKQNLNFYGGFSKSYDKKSFWLSLNRFLLNRIRLALFRNLVWTNGIYMSRSPHERIPEIGFLEDVVLSDELKKSALSWQPSESTALVSARRYVQDGIFLRFIFNVFILMLFRTGFVGSLKLKQVYQWKLHFGKFLPDVFHKKVS